MNRRSWFDRVLMLVGGGFGAAITIPLVGNILSPIFERRLGKVWQSVAPIDSFTVGEVSKAVVTVSDDQAGMSVIDDKGVFVWRQTDDEVVVFSRNCTDLSCPVTWDEGSRWFYCPCHGGVFNEEGQPVAGPPSRPLYRYDVRIRDNMVQIDLNSLPPMT